MGDEKTKLRLEIAHVLFIDIVGYSNLLIDEQTDVLQQLNRIVRSTDAVLQAEEAGQLIRLPTGDGMALVFTSSTEAPVECALQISQILRGNAKLPVRMGIHSGPVHHVEDVNERTNIAGAGINVAQRVMDCGDAGHILLSKRVADDLAQYRQWQPYLHDLGECEVKHGGRVHVFSAYSDGLGNRELPARFKEHMPSSAKLPTNRKWIAFGAIALFAVAAVIAFLAIRPTPSRRAVGKISTENKARAGARSLPVPEKSIAVLPFQNLSESKENEFFADGVQDDILTALSKVADLKVTSRTSVMSYAANTKRDLREIAQALGVSHVLEGSVRRADGKVRVSAQLIDARTDTHLWADTYDRDLADVFAIQTEIAKTIVDQLRTKLSPSEKAAIEERPTKDITAHDLYVRAKLLNESSSFSARRLEKLVEAADLLDQAVSRDPDFLLAHCLLANTHALIYFYGLDHSPGRRALADAAVKAAERLRPDAGETHLARADFVYRCYLDYDRARAELALAQRALPNNAQVLALTSFIDRRQSRWQEAIDNLGHALQLDPRNWYFLQQISLSYHFLRRYPDEAAALDRAIAILPQDAATRVARGWVDLEWKADPRPIRDTIDAIRKADPAAAVGFANYLMVLTLYERDAQAAEDAVSLLPPQGSGPDGVIFTISFWKALIARMQGDSVSAQAALLAARAQIEAVLREQPDYALALCTLGMIDAGLGRKDEAIREGRRACELLPVTKDAINGIHMMEFLGVVYAWTGEKDRAIDQLTATLKYPGSISYGQLRLHPLWDPLRGDPRFDQIVASLAPK